MRANLCKMCANLCKMYAKKKVQIVLKTHHSPDTIPEIPSYCCSTDLWRFQKAAGKLISSCPLSLFFQVYLDLVDPVTQPSRSCQTRPRLSCPDMLWQASMSRPLPEVSPLLIFLTIIPMSSPLKGMVHLIYKLYLKAVILCVKFNGAIGFS